MPDKRKQTSTHDDHFENVLAMILQEEEAGKPVDLSRLVRKNPELETRLREFFRDRDGFDRLAPYLAPQPCGAADPSDLVPGSLFAGYEIVRELGRGGMGIVYLARQKSANRLVALKVIRMDRLQHLRPRQREKWLIRFRKEGQVHARIADEGVVPVYEVGAHGGRPFFSMRYVAGRTLAAILEANPLPNRAAAIQMEQVARALQAIHDQGALHRDLKPHNIFVDKRGRPFISDFGLAKWMDAADCVTHTGEMLGTPHYMSPEQVQNAAHATKASDIYGLGATLYAVLTGKPPFPGTTLPEILYQVRFREPVSPRRLNPAIDRDLETITLKCLEKEPERRFARAKEVANELKRYLDGRPIRTRPLGITGRLWRWCRRNPALAAVSAAAVVFVMLAGALLPAYLLASREAVDAKQEVADNKKSLDDAIEKVDKTIEEAEGTKKVLGKTKEERDQEQELRRARTFSDDMGRAQTHVNAGELAEARELLAKWRHEEGKTDLRAWEWYFFDALCREAGFAAREKAAQEPAAGSEPGLSERGHTSQVLAVAWSAKEPARLASIDGLGNLKIWDLANPKKPQQLKSLAGGALALAWSPDGKYLAVASDGIVPVATPPPALPPGLPGSPAPNQGKPGDGHGAKHGSKTGGADGKAPGNANEGSVQVWDVESGKELHKLKTAPNMNPSLAFPSKPGEPVFNTHIFLGSWTMSLMWSPDGKRLALADSDGKIQIWNVAKDKEPLVLKAHQGGVHAAAWSPIGQLLASVGGDGIVKVWDPAAKNKEVLALPVRKTDNPISLPSFALVWNEDGKRLNVATGDGEISVCDIAARKLESTQKLVPRDPLAEFGVGRIGSRGERFVWSPDGTQLASVQTGGEVKIWDAATGKEGRSIDTRRPGEFMLLAGMCAPAWDSKGRRLALGTADGTVRAVPVATKVARRQPVRRLIIPNVNVLDWSADSRHLLGTYAWSLANDDAIKARKAQMEEILKAIQAARSEGITPPDLGAIVQKPGPGGSGVVGAKPHPQIHFCDAITGEVIRTLGNDVKTPDVLAESPPDGKWVAAATRNGLLQLWAAAGGEPLTLEKPAEATAPPGGLPNDSVVLSWRADGTLLAFSTSGQTTVRLWDPTNPRDPVKKLEGHGVPLCSLAWSRDGARLASAADDGTIKVWDVSSGKVIFDDTFYVKQNPGNGTGKHRASSTLSISPDGKLLAVAGEDETVRILDVDGKKELKTLIGHPSPYDIHDAACAVAWSPDGKRLASASPDGTFLLWDTATWNEVLALRPPSEGPFAPRMGLTIRVGRLAWSPDGRQLACFGGSVIWDATPEENQAAHQEVKPTK
jgi:WD40 repeat protein/serine/threonine protein kinase